MNDATFDDPSYSQLYNHDVYVKLENALDYILATEHRSNIGTAFPDSVIKDSRHNIPEWILDIPAYNSNSMKYYCTYSRFGLGLYRYSIISI